MSFSLSLPYYYTFDPSYPRGSPIDHHSAGSTPAFPLYSRIMHISPLHPPLNTRFFVTDLITLPLEGVLPLCEEVLEHYKTTARHIVLEREQRSTSPLPTKSLDHGIFVRKWYPARIHSPMIGFSTQLRRLSVLTITHSYQALSPPRPVCSGRQKVKGHILLHERTRGNSNSLTGVRNHVGGGVTPAPRPDVSSGRCQSRAIILQDGTEGDPDPTPRGAYLPRERWKGDAYPPPPRPNRKKRAGGSRRMLRGPLGSRSYVTDLGPLCAVFPPYALVCHQRLNTQQLFPIECALVWRILDAFPCPKALRV
ncbi:hypothetical protein BJ165DRAFT_1530665 [Panaeolus papilionaceus]|nr:hypothetical protein BJ165DRAFT_1530665 [Panaeolus papilionaceus]